MTMGKVLLRSVVVMALAVIIAGAAAACSSKASPVSPGAGSASAAPTSMAALIAGSKHEQGLLIFSNANLPLGEGGGAGIAQVDKAFEAKYPWIHVTATDDNDPVVFSKYAAEHATGIRTADILVASAPGLWVGAVSNGYLQPFTPAGISGFPSLVSQGHGLYVFSADPTITIYNKAALKGKAAPSTIAAIVQAAKAGQFKLGTFTIANQFGYSVFWAYVHQKGWAALDALGQVASAPGDGGVLGLDVLQGGLGVGVFESGVARGAISHIPTDAKLGGWQYAKDFTPLVPRGIGITVGAASPDSAKLYLDFVYSNAGQQAMCDAGFEAMSNTFTPSDGCQNTLKALYAAVGGARNTYMTPFTQQVANDQASFTARWRKAFHQ